MRSMQSAITALALSFSATTANALEPALAPDMQAGTSITFAGPTGDFTWVLESREDGLYHWRSSSGTWVKRTNFGPVLEWTNAGNSGSTEFDGSHAGLYPLEVGKSSTIKYTSSKGNYIHQTCKVLEVETITVPLGTFPTYPVDCKYVVMKTGKVAKHRTYFYSPEHRFYIRRMAGSTAYEVIRFTPPGS